MADRAIESKVTIPVSVQQGSEWVPKLKGRGGRYRKRFEAWFFLSFEQYKLHEFMRGYVGYGPNGTKAREALTDTLIKVLDEFAEPEFLQLGEFVTVVYCRPSTDGISWGSRLISSDGNVSNSCLSSPTRDEARRSAVNNITQWYCGVDFWDPERIDKAAQFAELHGLPARNVHRDCASQRGMAYAAAIGERDPHGWMFDKTDEFLDRWDRPEQGATT